MILLNFNLGEIVQETVFFFCDFIAFACNAKNFAIVFFFLSSLFAPFWEGLAKVICVFFSLSALVACDQYRTYY